jgi:hypothetical protein
LQWRATGRWFSPGPPVSSNKTDRHDLTEILLKVALNTIKQTNKQTDTSIFIFFILLIFLLDACFLYRWLWDCTDNILFFLDKTAIMKYYLTALIYLFTQLYNTYVYGSNGKLSSY